jgi:hypothetical protein
MMIDIVAIVVYGSDAQVVLLPTSSEDRTTILNAIYGIISIIRGVPILFRLICDYS